MKFVGWLVVAVSLAWLSSRSGGALAAPPEQSPAKTDFRTLDEIYRRLDQDLRADFSYFDGGDNTDVLRTYVLKLEERAEAGDRVAQFELAAVHLGNLHGHGDAGRAWHWLLEAAGPDHPLTQLAYGRHRLRASYEYHGVGSLERGSLHIAIYRMAPNSIEAVRVLEREMRRETHFGRFDVARSLCSVGERGIEVLIGMLDGKDRDLRIAAINGLQQGLAVADAKTLARFTPRITALAGDEDPLVRKGAEQTLARIKEMEPYRKHRDAGLTGHPPRPHGAKTPETAAKVVRLIGELKSPDAKIKKAAADALAALHGEACTAVPALLPLLKDPDKAIRQAAVHAIWYIGPDGVEVDTTTPLTAALDDKETGVCSYACYAIAASRPPAEQAIPKLLTLVADRDSSADYAAADALTSLAQRGHAKEITAGLLGALRGAEQPPLKVIETLGKIGKHAQSAIPDLEPLMKHEDFKVRLAAAHAVILIGGEPTDRAIALLRAEMRTDDHDRRHDAVRALMFIGPQVAVALPDIIALYDDPGQAAVESFRRSAEQGNADAQLELGLALREGLAGVPDPRAAEVWIRRAAEQGQPEAQRRLAIMSRLGSGARRDEAAAEAWYRKSVLPRVAQRISGPRVSEKEFQAALAPHASSTWNVDPSSEGRARMSLATIGRLLPGKRKVRHLQVLSDGDLHEWDLALDQSMPASDQDYTAHDSLDVNAGEELLRLLADLPAGVSYVPVEQRLVFSFFERGAWKTHTYDTAALPPKIRLILFHVGLLDDSFEPDPRLAPVLVRTETPLLRDISFQADGTLRMFGDESRVRGRRDGRAVALTDSALDALPGAPLGLSHDGSRVVVYSQEHDRNRLSLYDTRARRVVADLGKSEYFYMPSVKACFSADGTVFTPPNNRKADSEFRNAATGEVRAKFTCVEGADTAFSPDGKLAAVRVGDGTVQLFDTATGIALQTFPGVVATFTRDGKQLAVRSREELTLFEPATGARQAMPLKLPKAEAGPIVFSPDGRLLACVYDQDRVAVFDVAARHIIGLAGPHDRRDPRKRDDDNRYSSLVDVEFTPDGKTLATASRDSVVKLWDVQSIRRED
jgi:TPR repeat protein